MGMILRSNSDRRLCTVCHCGWAAVAVRAINLNKLSGNVAPPSRRTLFNLASVLSGFGDIRLSLFGATLTFCRSLSLRNESALRPAAATELEDLLPSS